MTAAEAVRDLFAHLPRLNKDLIWLADELIGIAQHLGSIAIEIERDDAGARSLVCRSVPTLTLAGRGPVYLFRPLLARLAVLGADETGTEPQLYGGRYALVRSSRGGPVRLEVAFTNTPAAQQLTITRVPVSVGPRVPELEAEGAAEAPRPAV